MRAPKFVTSVLLMVSLATAPASAAAQPEHSAADATEPIEEPQQPAAEPPRERSSDEESAASEGRASEGRASAAGEPRTAADAGRAGAGAAEAQADAEEDEGDDAWDVEPERPSTLGWSDDRALAWATFAAGIAVLATGAILVAVGVDDLNTVENASDGTSWSAVRASYGRVPVLTATGFVVLGIGAVGTAVGAALLSVYGEGGTWLELSAAPGSLRLRGRF